MFSNYELFEIAKVLTSKRDRVEDFDGFEVDYYDDMFQLCAHFKQTDTLPGTSVVIMEYKEDIFTRRLDTLENLITSEPY